ncbi:MAG: nucleotide disphospho-sugar-binding domain-containing protein [Terracidiphilus sp.]
MTAEHRAWHFGVLPFTGTGHVNPLIALSQELTARGHKVTFFEKPKIADRVRHAGLNFVPLSGDNSSKPTSPPAATPAIWSDIATLGFNLKRVTADIEQFLRTAPPALRRSGVDALIINEVALTGPTIAELLRLPYFIISTSVPHSFGWNPSPWLSPRDYSGSWIHQLQKTLLELSVFQIRGPIRRVIDRYRQNIGLYPVKYLEKLYPCLAHITQIPKCLDLPRTSIPANFHYAGPFVSTSSRPLVDFSWHRLDGRPLIYASLGTTRNVQPLIFNMIAEACRGLDAQLIISLGGRFSPEQFGALPGDPLLVPHAPQLDLLKLAAIVITHAGSNTVLETLMESVPILAIPIAHDQPAIAARLARLNLAQVIPPRARSAETIRAALVTLLSDSRYRDSAQQIGAQMRSLRGAGHAADLIEAALAKHEGLSYPKSNLAHSASYASVSS